MFHSNLCEEANTLLSVRFEQRLFLVFSTSCVFEIGSLICSRKYIVMRMSWVICPRKNERTGQLVVFKGVEAVLENSVTGLICVLKCSPGGYV